MNRRLSLALLLACGLGACKTKEEAPPPPKVFGAAARAAGAQQKAAPPPAPRAAAPTPAQASAAQHAAQMAAAAGPARRPAGTGPQAQSDSAVDSLHIDYRREVYNYQGGARDPFGSLLTTNASQTSISDLHLVSILYDAQGGSIAVVRDRNTPRPYKLRRGDSVGRLRVIQIRQYEVVFQVEEFGFERQEVLALIRPEVNR